MIDLAARRVLENQKIAHAEKVFSFFEPDTELINRGKVPYPIEFGHRVLIVEDSAGFILTAHMMEPGQTDPYFGVAMRPEHNHTHWQPLPLKSEFLSLAESGNQTLSSAAFATK
jgi:hypothetical protein